jgi:hypothetical protein
MEKLKSLEFGKALTCPPPMLMDMRWVMDTPRKAGEEESLTNIREMLRKQPKVFWERMAQLERDWLAAENLAREHLMQREKLEAMAKGQTTLSEEVPDEGTPRILELAEGYLKGVGL